MKKYFKQRLRVTEYTSGCKTCLARVMASGNPLDCLVNYRICKTIAKWKNTSFNYIEGLGYEEIF